MQEFNGMSRDTVRAKTPNNKWEFARNILLSKNFTSVTAEDGFDIKYFIPGEFLGKIETNTILILFSVDDTYSYIGYYDTSKESTTYIPVIKTIHFSFNIKNPIEGVYFVNYKGEVIIGFCDGVNNNSNSPKLLNINNIGVPLDGDKEFIDAKDVTKLQLFPDKLEGDIKINYLNSSSLDADIAYITYSYLLSDKESTTGFFPIHTISYPVINFRGEYKRDIEVELTNLDTRYTQIQLGVVTYKDGGIFAYKSLPLSYKNGSIKVLLTTLSGYTSISPEVLLVGTSIYDKIETMTMNNKELYVGGVKTDTQIDFQKYANLLELDLNFDLRPKELKAEPTLLPDEVYAFYISLQFFNGTYSKEFHIPAPRGFNSSELSVIPDATLISLGLDNLVGKGYKNFQIFNTGGWVNETTALPLPNTIESKLRWGHWFNTETYPNTEDYNSLTSYNGNPIVNGFDLRGTPIHYHRVPGLDSLVKKFPCILGRNNENQTVDNTTSLSNFKGAVPAFHVTVSNFLSVVPTDILNRIQGYKLSIAKREGERLIEDINFLHTSLPLKRTISGSDILSESSTPSVLYNLPTITSSNSPDSAKYFNTHFGRAVLRSSLLNIAKPSVANVLVKANYAYLINNFTISNVRTEYVDTTGEFIGDVGPDTPISLFLVPNTQRYSVLKSLKYLPGNNITEENHLTEEQIVIETINSIQVPNTTLGIGWNPLNFPLSTTKYRQSYQLAGFFNGQYTVTNGANGGLLGVSSTFINLLFNLYSGFNPDSFITINKTSLEANNTPSLSSGDVFTNNCLNIVHSNWKEANIVEFNNIVYKGSFSIYNNSEVYGTKDKLLSTDYPLTSTNLSLLQGLDYTNKIFNKEVYRSYNDLIIGLPFNSDKEDINYFPYKVSYSLPIQTENTDTNPLRTFLANNYINMLSDRGKVVALRGSNKTLFIQQEYSLFIAKIKDRLTTKAEVTYLGEAAIFDRFPDEVLEASNKGYLGSTNKLACTLYRDGYVTVDSSKGKCFIVLTSGEAVEISKIDMVNWFEQNFKDNLINYSIVDVQGKEKAVDNPYNSVGFLIGFDLQYNRLLFTKKDYRLKPGISTTGLSFDGEFYYLNGTRLRYTNKNYFIDRSITLSYSLDGKTWVCEHDYFPKVYMYTNYGLYSIGLENGFIPNRLSIYRHNSKDYKGLYYEELFESYIDLIFNGRLDLVKLYQNISWHSSSVNPYENTNYYFQTIDSLVVYNDNQCSEEMVINQENIRIARNLEGEWQCNTFRDMVIDRSLPLIDSRGVLNLSNINMNRNWFDKSNFISTFIVVRMIMKNLSNNTISINSVNVKSRLSDRT